jgi:hypothetical protein
VVVVESHGLLHARLKNCAGADRDVEFVSWRTLDQDGARLILGSMMGRLLDDGDLRKLQRMLIKKPPAPSVRRRILAKRRAGKW